MGALIPLSGCRRPVHSAHTNAASSVRLSRRTAHVPSSPRTLESDPMSAASRASSAWTAGSERSGNSAPDAEQALRTRAHDSAAVPRLGTDLTVPATVKAFQVSPQSAEVRWAKLERDLWVTHSHAAERALPGRPIREGVLPGGLLRSQGCPSPHTTSSPGRTGSTGRTRPRGRSSHG